MLKWLTVFIMFTETQGVVNTQVTHLLGFVSFKANIGIAFIALMSESSANNKLVSRADFYDERYIEQPMKKRGLQEWPMGILNV